MPHPTLTFFPAVSLAQTIDLGAWRVGTPDASVPWLDATFEGLSRALVQSFASQGYRSPTLVWRAATGFDGVPPTWREQSALQAAITFGLVDANDRVARDQNAGHFLATTENGQLWVQPIDTQSGFITHSRGGFWRPVMDGGHKIGGPPPPLMDATVPIQRAKTLSRVLCSRVYERVMSHGPRADRFRTAVEWLFIAISNPRAVTFQQRVIALKTGFETVVSESNSRVAAHLLRNLFERTTWRHNNILPWNGLLWSPREQQDIVRRYQVERRGRLVWRLDWRTDLEDWFVAFAQLRNEIIHDGTISHTTYQSPRRHSRYNGNYVEIGERLLREAIKALAGADVLLARRIEEIQMWQPLVDELRRARAEAPPPAEPPPPAAPGDAGRTLPELLAALQVDDPADATITVVDAEDSGDLGDQGSLPPGRRWFAYSPHADTGLTVTERDTLSDAGATIDDGDTFASDED